MCHLGVLRRAILVGDAVIVSAAGDRIQKHLIWARTGCGIRVEKDAAPWAAVSLRRSR